MTRFDLIEHDDTAPDAIPEEVTQPSGGETPPEAGPNSTDSSANDGAVCGNRTGPAPMVKSALGDPADDPPLFQTWVHSDRRTVQGTGGGSCVMVPRATPKALTGVSEHGEKTASDKSATVMRFTARHAVNARVLRRSYADPDTAGCTVGSSRAGKKFGLLGQLIQEA